MSNPKRALRSVSYWPWASAALVQEALRGAVCTIARRRLVSAGDLRPSVAGTSIIRIRLEPPQFDAAAIIPFGRALSAPCGIAPSVTSGGGGGNCSKDNCACGHGWQHAQDDSEDRGDEVSRGTDDIVRHEIPVHYQVVSHKSPAT